MSRPFDDPDIDLARLRALDAATFDLAFTAYAPRLNAWLRRLGASPVVAEELVQEAFVRLVRHAARLAPDTRLGAWLYTVTRNLWRSHRRWSWLDGARILEWADTAARPRDTSPAEHAAAGRLLEAAERAVRALPVAQREVFLLVVVEGLDPTEAASVLGIQPEAARQRLARARRTLEEVLP